MDERTQTIDEPAPHAAGRVLGNVRLNKELGSGGMGAVYAAEHLLLKKTVAVKLIRREIASRKGAVERFLREAQLAAAIKDEEFVAVTDAGFLDGECYIVMEYVAGGSLRERLSPGQPLPLEIAVGIALTVARGLRKALGHGIIHRDIKPGNILLTEDGHAKIADLGLAKILGDEPSEAEPGLTREGSLMGSPGYMAPEQTVNAKGVDHRADIFALGATLYEMLTGCRAFAGSDAEAATKTVCAEPAAISGEAGRRLGPIVGKMLKKNPDHRYASYDELIADLERSLAKPASRPRAAWLVPALVVGSLLVGLGMWRLMRDPGSAKQAATLATAVPAAVPAKSQEPACRSSDDCQGRQCSDGQCTTLPAVSAGGKCAHSGQCETFHQIPQACSLSGSDRLCDCITRKLPTSVAPTKRECSLSLGGERPTLAMCHQGLCVACTKDRCSSDQTATGEVEAATAPTRDSESPEVQIMVHPAGAADHHWVLLKDGASLSSASKYFIKVRPSRGGYLYVFQVDARGGLNILFPHLMDGQFSGRKNPVAANTAMRLPSHDDLGLDEILGKEHIYAVMKNERWKDLESILVRAIQEEGQGPLAMDQERGIARLVKSPSPPKPSNKLRRASDHVVHMLTGTAYTDRWFEHVAAP